MGAITPSSPGSAPEVGGRYWKPEKNEKLWVHTWQIINNSSAADWSILLKFGTELDYATAEVHVLGKFKVEGSKVMVTAWHDASEIKR